MNDLKEQAITLLKQLISIPSLSRTEEKTAGAMEAFFRQKDIPCQRLLNNIWVVNKEFDAAKPTILLNSHHDTVKSNANYTRDPFEAAVEDGQLFGLGSNDAGGPLVSLIACFLYFYNKTDLKFNLIMAATAEEEISGANGIELLLPQLPPIYFGIVGEPTKMDMAVAEKGLLVLDCQANGVAGHAARDEGENAIYKAMKDIAWFQSYQFPKISETLGAVKMTVTMIQAGTQHNVIPAACTFTVDIRTTDQYSHAEILETIGQHVSCGVKPRSLRLQPSGISNEHPAVQAGKLLNRKLYGSPTLSDQALMNFSTLKMGPGDSSRSHTADEFIFIHEIEDGIDLYIQFINTLNTLL